MPQRKEKKSWIGAALQWLAPLMLSAVVGYGSVQYAQGAAAQKLSAVERDVTALERKIDQAKADQSNYPTREEFKLMLDDVKEIKTDVREIRRSLMK